MATEALVQLLDHDVRHRVVSYGTGMSAATCAP